MGKGYFCQTSLEHFVFLCAIFNLYVLSITWHNIIELCVSLFYLNISNDIVVFHRTVTIWLTNHHSDITVSFERQHSLFLHIDISIFRSSDIPITILNAFILATHLCLSPLPSVLLDVQISGPDLWSAGGPKQVWEHWRWAAHLTESEIQVDPFVFTSRSPKDENWQRMCQDLTGPVGEASLNNGRLSESFPSPAGFYPFISLMRPLGMTWWFPL